VIPTETGLETSDRLQDLIDEVFAMTGDRPIIRINAGTYRLNGISMKSNVHIRLDKDVVIKVVLGARGSNIFETGNNRVENFSIFSDNGSFTIDFTELDVSNRVRAFFVTDIENFKIANINILDNNTFFSSLAFFSTGNSIPSVRDVIQGLADGTITTRPIMIEDPSDPIRPPMRGIIENIVGTGANYGFGTIQVQGGQNLLFRNIESTGGVALRLETGANFWQILGDLTPILDEIYGFNITGINGQSPLTLSPHTLKHNKVVLEKITAISCEYGAGLERGFVSQNTSGRPQQNNPILGLTPGNFANATISNVTATFGQNAQLRPTRLRYIPCNLRVLRNLADTEGVSNVNNPDGQSFRGPSLFPISNEASEPGPGGYIVTINNLTFSGYGSNTPADGMLIDGTNDFEICDEVISGLNFFVPRRDRNTPNDLNNEFCNRTDADGNCNRLGRTGPPILSIGTIAGEREKDKLSIYPNPTSNFLEIESKGEIKLQIYNSLGALVRTKNFIDRTTVNVQGLGVGLFFVRINNNGIYKVLFK